MKVEVWSDFICPFCYIGERKLEAALEELSLQEDVEIEFKSYELDPHSPVYSGKSFYEALASKYRMTIEQVKASSRQIERQAQEVGLSYNFEAMKITNTLDAHRLAKLAEKSGQEKVMIENLFAAYFLEGGNLSDKETLLKIASASGVDANEAAKVLKDQEAYLNEVRNDENQAKDHDVTYIPHFVIDQKYSISGVIPMEKLVNILKKAWDETKLQHRV